MDGRERSISAWFAQHTGLFHPIKHFSPTIWLYYSNLILEHDMIILRNHCLDTRENIIACDNLKQIISEALLHDKTLKEIPLEMRSTNIGAFLSKKMKQETTNVILEKAGPSLNMKITGPQGRILFDCDFLLSFPLVFWPSPASEWIERARSWPDQATIQRLASLPCHVIAKPMTEGHRYTWRFSFSRQVR